jgi:hygromycin-B 7''-O-kinase
MAASPSLTRLETLEGYRQSFMDAGLWHPFVEWVCLKHGWVCDQVDPAGIAGSFPTFIVDKQRVFKFFGPLFEGGTCWRVEQESAQLLPDLPDIPTARLLVSGTLETLAGWKYLVFEYVPGGSIAGVYAEIPFDEKHMLASWLGDWLSRMHSIRVPPGSALPTLNVERARSWFTDRWREDRSRWPVHLAGQVEDYLSANAAFLQSGSGAFIHADLTQDHFIGRLTEGHWETLAVIDFGDAMRGNVFYELAALHLDLFDCDKRLLRTFLHAYGFSPDPDFVCKAMVTTLMHQFDVYGHLFDWKPELKESRNLEEVAERLWNLER